MNHFDINYLYPFQRLTISNILEASEAKLINEDSISHQIVILPTGGGKSLCFMLPALLLKGPTLVIFPLLSLIKDQLRRCQSAEIPAAELIGGQSQNKRKEIFSSIKNGSIKMVLTNPETALSNKALQEIKECNFNHLVFDEVHTVSEWGESFRPAYLESKKLYEETNIPIVTAFTATASENVLSKIKSILFPDITPHIVNANPDRPNIFYRVIPSLCKELSLEIFFSDKGITKLQLPALVFCSSRKTTEKIALELRLRLKNNEIFFYHAGLEKTEKNKIEKWFFESENGILCATTAYGMGIDKPNIRTVIHYNLPSSIEAYLQETGRAGRDRSPSEAILLLSPSDKTIQKINENKHSLKRYKDLLNVVLQNDSCRREAFLKLLGSEIEYCSGCDVCQKKVISTPALEKEIIQKLFHKKRSFTIARAAQLFSTLFEISEKDCTQILEELIIDNKIKLIKHGPWKNLLSIEKQALPENKSKIDL